MTFPPGYDHACMMSAENAAQASQCSRRQVGAYLLTAGGFYSISAANTIRSLKSSKSCDGICPRTLEGADLSSYTNCISVHAEAAVLLSAGTKRSAGSTLYTTSFPCWDCAKLIVFAGVEKVYTYLEDRDGHRVPQRQMDYMTENGVMVYEIHR